MAFTGDLEQLHIVDIIQLVNTTRKSGTFSVKGSRGESRIIFSNGYIVGASHLNNKVRIGTVLVKMGATTLEDLNQALEVQKRAGKGRKPLIATLIELGKLGREQATRGLKKLIEMTLVELIGWKSGTFTLDTDVITVSAECSYPLSKMEQEISLDAQMLLMDALRVFDERQRDQQSGKSVQSEEELFSDVISSGSSAGDSQGRSAVITADDLGLGDLDRLERKIPQFLPADELFDPTSIHRQKIKEILAGFSAEQQEAFVSFLEKSTVSRGDYGGSQKQEDRAKGVIMFSEDELIKHSVMTICKDEGVLVFATDEEEELAHIIDQCLKIKVWPVLVFDDPETSGGILSREKIVSLRQQVKERYPLAPIIQIASLTDYGFTLRSFDGGCAAVFPKPGRKTAEATFIEDTVKFLTTFKSYIKRLFIEQTALDAEDVHLSKLKARSFSLRDLNDPSAVSLALLQYVSELFERSVTFIVRPAELIGERAIGVYAGKNEGPTQVTRLKIPLPGPSLFREVIEKGQCYYGESQDEVLTRHLFEVIGAPLSPTIILLPVISRGKTVALTYGDFGDKESQPVQSDMLEILATQAGLVLEKALYRKQISQASLK